MGGNDMWYIKAGKYMYFVDYNFEVDAPVFINDRNQAYCSDGYFHMRKIHLLLKDQGVDCQLVYST